MEGINWNEAPEGATHYVIGGFGDTPWRKVTDNKVYEWRADRWCECLVITVAKYLRANRDLLVAKPAEAALPNGPQWPEGYIYYNPHGLNGFFFNEEEYVWNGVVAKWAVEMDYWKTHKATIRRYGNAKADEVVEQPAPKKKVGWWG